MAASALTGFSITPRLPTGLELAADGSISGTAVATSRQSYVISATSNGKSVSGHLLIAVKEPAISAVSYSPATLSCQVGQACASPTPTVTGGAPSAFTSSPTLPAGLTIDLASGLISGTPTSPSSSASFTITATNESGSATTTLAITVDDVGPSGLIYATSNAVCTLGQPCALSRPHNDGGAVASFSIAPALPTGLTFDTATGAIAGTASQLSAPTDYAITATNAWGSTSTTLRLAVNDVAPSALTYAVTSLSCTKGQVCSLAKPVAMGGAITLFSVDFLPSGLVLDLSTGAISGTPTVLVSARAITITATNTGGSTSATLTLVVADLAPTALTYSPDTATCTQGQQCHFAAPTNSGGTITAYGSAPPLPASLTLSAAGEISGVVHSEPGTSSFTITGSNATGAATATVKITVVETAPTSITYAGTLVCQRTVPCTAPAPTFAGGTPTSYSVSPSLPAGFTLNPTTGAVTGTSANVLSTTNYTVTGHNSQGDGTGTFSLRVNELAPSNIVYSASVLTCTSGTACSLAAPTTGGGPPTSFSISPGLPSGLTLNTTTGAISGTPVNASTLTTYTVTANNSGGNGTTTLQVVVLDPAPTALTYSPSTIVCGRGAVCSIPRPTNGGGPVRSFAVSPQLPPGLTLSTTTGAIAGRPTDLVSPSPFVITATNTGGTTSATITISVVALAPGGLSYSSQPCLVGASCSFAPLSTGGVPQSYSVSPTPPSWVTFDTSTGIASGIPTAAAAPVTLTVTATNSLGTTTGKLTIVVLKPVGDLPALTGSFDITNFKGFGIDPKKPNTMYVVDFDGRVFTSTNAGSTWALACVSRASQAANTPYYGNVLVSPSGAAFVNYHTNVDRIVSNGGGACQQLSRSIWATYEVDHWFAFTPAGKIYCWNASDSNPGPGLATSDDEGVTWSLVAGSTPSLFRTIAIDPFDSSRLLSVHSQWSTSPSGIVLGASTQLSTATSDYNQSILFDPIHQGFIFIGTTGNYSTNGGTTWAKDSARFAVQAFDANGVGYRLETVGSSVVLRTAPDLHVAAPVWSTISTLPETSLDTPDVKVSGTNVMVMNASHIYLSTNGGSTFTQVKTTLTSLNATANSAAANGNTIYFASQKGLLRTFDDTATWSIIDFRKDAQLYVSLSNPLHAYLRPTGGYQDDLTATSTGFTTSSTLHDSGSGWYGNAPTFALDQVDDRQAYAFASSRVSKTIDSSTSWSTVTIPFAPGLSWPTSWSYASEVNPWNESQVFFIDTSTPTLWLYDHVKGTNTDRTNALPFQDPAGLEVVRLGASSYKLRVISRGGSFAESTDGTTFQLVSASPALTGPSARILRTAPQNPAWVATANWKGSEFSVSFDSGASWVVYNQVCSSGTVYDVAFSATRLVIACGPNAPIRTLPLPN